MGLLWMTETSREDGAEYGARLSAEGQRCRRLA